MTYKTTIEIDIEVEFSATPYDPGVCYGPPESCYPPEGGEVEVEEVLFNNQKIELTDKLYTELTLELEQKIADFDSGPDYD